MFRVLLVLFSLFVFQFSVSADVTSADVNETVDEQKNN